MIEFLNYRRTLPKNVWPKEPPPLNPDQIAAREKYMMLWHQQLQTSYPIVEKFNHGFVAQLPFFKGSKTLEIGAGIGGHLAFENLKDQDYYALEYREEFCEILRQKLPPDRVFCGDIHVQQAWPNQTFDRIIAIHVLEHLRNLPLALKELARLLKPNGFLDIVIPCEAGLAHTFARKISAQKLFESTFKMPFLPVHLNEHVNSYSEVVGQLDPFFTTDKRQFFPLRIPLPNFNLCAGMRLRRRL